MNDCIFCKIIQGSARSWNVFEDANTLAFLDIHPANRYHTLVIPKAHYESIFDLPEADLIAVARAAKAVTSLYQQKLGINNLQMINSSGREAQQDVFHFHLHILPRKLGDGQNVRWVTHPEWVKDFDSLLERIRS